MAARRYQNWQYAILAQVTAWHLLRTKPFPEPMMTWFIDPYVRHQALIDWTEIVKKHVSL